MVYTPQYGDVCIYTAKHTRRYLEFYNGLGRASDSKTPPRARAPELQAVSCVSNQAPKVEPFVPSALDPTLLQRCSVAICGRARHTV